MLWSRASVMGSTLKVKMTKCCHILLIFKKKLNINIFFNKLSFPYLSSSPKKIGLDGIYAKCRDEFAYLNVKVILVS